MFDNRSTDEGYDVVNKATNDVPLNAQYSTM